MFFSYTTFMLTKLDQGIHIDINNQQKACNHQTVLRKA